MTKPRRSALDDESFDQFLESAREAVEVRVFLCGRAVDRNRLEELAISRADKRAYLWSRLENEVAGCKVLLGEHDFLINAYGNIFKRTAKDSKKVNLALFEAALARHVHLIVLFPESVGSFAELGLFTAPGGVANKLLVVIEKHREGIDTFVNSFLFRGPVATVRAERGHVRYLDYDDLDGIYDAVREMVEHIAERLTTQKIFVRSDL